MIRLHDILQKLKNEFAHSRKGSERGIWFGEHYLFLTNCQQQDEVWAVVHQYGSS